MRDYPTLENLFAAYFHQDWAVEHGSADEVILAPKAAYTKRLINDVPKIYEPWDLSTV